MKKKQIVIEFAQNGDVDVLDVIRRSPVSDTHGAAELLRASVMRSAELWVGYVDRQIACVVGIMGPTILSDVGYIWMLHTDLALEHQFIFVRRSQLWVEKLMERYQTVSGHCKVDNFSGQRWLRWLGAEFDYTEGGMIPFVIKAKLHG